MKRRLRPCRHRLRRHAGAELEQGGRIVGDLGDAGRLSCGRYSGTGSDAACRPAYGCPAPCPEAGRGLRRRRLRILCRCPDSPHDKYTKKQEIRIAYGALFRLPGVAAGYSGLFLRVLLQRDVDTMRAKLPPHHPSASETRSASVNSTGTDCAANSPPLDGPSVSVNRMSAVVSMENNCPGSS